MRSIASIKLTLPGLVLLAAGVVYYASAPAPSAAWVVAPLGFLAVNLLAAIGANASFRADPPLLVFHVALLAVLLLAAAGRLTFLKGELELSEGEAFDGRLGSMVAGPWHPGGIEGVRFVNEGFTIRYAPGLKRGETRNVVGLIEADGSMRQYVIGDNEPLLAAGYRFYTTPNKGFSLVFRWIPEHGTVERGTVNLPSYPANEERQASQWTLPGTRTAVWTMLQFDAPPLDPEHETTFRKPEKHTVIVRVGDSERHVLERGGSVELANGTLVYEGLGTWMGYQVFYDWTMPWLLAACFTAIASLGLHFWRKSCGAAWDA